MATATAFVIVRPEHLVSVRKRLASAESVAVHSEAELDVQSSLLTRPPEILILQSAFAATSRGATLVAGLKAKPNPNGTAIRVFIEDGGRAPLLLSQEMLSPHDALLETSRPLDRAGTRQVARYPMNRRAVVVNGNAALLIDLSVTGAQVQVMLRVKPLQVIRFVLDEGLRLQGTVAWSIAVPGGGTIQYRAGVEFVNPDRRKLAAFCARHGGAPDRTLSVDEA